MVPSNHINALVVLGLGVGLGRIRLARFSTSSQRKMSDRKSPEGNIPVEKSIKMPKRGGESRGKCPSREVPGNVRLRKSRELSQWKSP